MFYWSDAVSVAEATAVCEIIEGVTGAACRGQSVWTMIVSVCQA